MLPWCMPHTGAKLMLPCGRSAEDKVLAAGTPETFVSVLLLPELSWLLPVMLQPCACAAHERSREPPFWLLWPLERPERDGMRLAAGC